MLAPIWKSCAVTAEKCVANALTFLSVSEPARMFSNYLNGSDNSSNHGRRLPDASGIGPMVVGGFVGGSNRRRPLGIGCRLRRNHARAMLPADSFAGFDAVSIWTRATISALFTQSDSRPSGRRWPADRDSGTFENPRGRDGPIR